MNLIEFGLTNKQTKHLVVLTYTEESDDAIAATISNTLVKNGLTCLAYPSLYGTLNPVTAVTATSALKQDVNQIDQFVTATLLRVTDIDSLSECLV